MAHESQLHDIAQARRCPVCNTSRESATLFLTKNIDQKKITHFSFSSRKEPEFMRHQLLRCTTCDLVYVDQPPPADELANAYHQAEYDSSEEARDAAKAYISAIQPTLNALKQHNDALEIGAGTGVFLEQLADQGFVNLIGIEPSAAAIAAASEKTRPWLREGIFSEADHQSNSFDLICCFMTMEHVPDPTIIASACHRLLRPGGAFVTVTHDYRGAVNRLLGSRSPIIDIEHMQLFSPTSIKQLFERTGFSDVTVNTFVNAYALRYWLRLMPLPRLVKRILGSCIAIAQLDKIKFSINVGNLITTGIKQK